MSDNPKTRKRDKKRIPTFLSTARRFYGESFGSRTRREYLESMADWAELSEDEQSFALAHLQYLNLLAQARGQRLLLQVHDLLDEVAGHIEDALDERDDDDDGFEGDEDQGAYPPEDGQDEGQGAGEQAKSEIARAVDELNARSDAEAEVDEVDASEVELGEPAGDEE